MPEFNGRTRRGHKEQLEWKLAQPLVFVDSSEPSTIQVADVIAGHGIREWPPQRAARRSFKILSGMEGTNRYCPSTSSCTPLTGSPLSTGSRL
jgi:hypothetical protein